MTKKANSLDWKCYFFCPLAVLTFFFYFSFCVSAALHFVSNFALKPPTEGESSMQTAGDLSPLTPPSGPKQNPVCSDGLQARTRGCHDRPQLLLMALLGCSSARLFYRCVRRRSEGAPLLIITQIRFCLIYDFKWRPAKLLKGPNLDPSISTSCCSGFAVQHKRFHSVCPQWVTQTQSFYKVKSISWEQREVRI